MRRGYVVEVLCVGEALAVFVPAEPGPADEVRTWRRTVGGAESNVARALAALGVPSAFAGAVGDDAFGRALVGELAAEGVDVRGVRADPARPTGLYVKENGASGTVMRYYRAGSAASAMGPELLSTVDLDGVRLVHLSGITPALSPGCHDLVRALLDAPRENRLVSFDVNWRPALWAGRDPAEVAALAARADLVLTGEDEAGQVWGTGEPARLRALLPGPATVVVKHGERGATLLECGRAPVFEPALAVDVVEPVGAGDAFAAGFLAATLRGEDARTRLRAGHLQAAATLLTRDDVSAPLPRGVVATLLRAGEQEWAAARLSGGELVHQ
ncbi:sugar kinase [Prauserella flavalba]|uniref:Sugar kinase n=1 Tax=Prauserella flavalba TaxID=1477506 RepID=A0A318LN39_9PSEU|nr:sugar kinase [Prauserella flavalba]PXY28516.1 sugar kinase [Prauserella flavalba]